MFFDGWEPLQRTLVIGFLSYVALVFLLRITGRRSLSKMNAFDFVVTVALGSTLASLLTSESVNLSQGVLAFFLLLSLQYAVTWTSVRVGWFRNVITGEPALLFLRGEFLPDALRKSRVTRQEVHAALRQDGHADPAKVFAVVMETDGSFSVLADGSGPSDGSLAGVRRLGSGDPGAAPRA